MFMCSKYIDYILLYFTAKEEKACFFKKICAVFKRFSCFMCVVGKINLANHWKFASIIQLALFS